MTNNTYLGWVRSPRPPSPPPLFIPPCPPGPPVPAFIIESVLAGALHLYIYVWLLGGDDFWVYPTTQGSGQIEGYCWRDGQWATVSVPFGEILHLYV